MTQHKLTRAKHSVCAECAHSDSEGWVDCSVCGGLFYPTEVDVGRTGKAVQQMKQDPDAPACECCDDQKPLVRGLCHSCTRSYFEDAERDLKEAQNDTQERLARLMEQATALTAEATTQTKLTSVWVCCHGLFLEALQFEVWAEKPTSTRGTVQKVLVQTTSDSDGELR